MVQQTFVGSPGQFGVVSDSSGPSKYPSGEAIQNVFSGIDRIVAGVQERKATSAFEEEIAGVEAQVSEAKNIVGDLESAVSARSEELLQGIDTSTVGGSLEALNRVATLNEDPVVGQLRNEIKKINEGTRQGIVSPLAERAMKLAAARRYINRYPAFADRLKNLADESLGYTMTEEGVRTLLPAMEDGEGAEQAAARKKLQETAANFGIYDIDNPATMRVLQQMALTAHGRQLLSSKGNVSQLTAAETGDLYRMSAQEQLTKLTNDLGQDMVNRGLDPAGPIPPDLVVKYSTLGRQIKDSHSADMQSSLMKAMVDKDQIDTATSWAVASPVDGWLKGLEEGNGKTLNTDMLKNLIDADKYQLYVSNPDYLRMVNMGIDPNTTISTMGDLVNQSTLTGGKDSPIWLLSLQNNKPLHKYHEIIRGAMKNSGFLSAVGAKDPASAMEQYEALDDDTKALVQALAQMGFKKGSPAPTTEAGKRTTQNMIGLAAEAMAKDGSKSSFTFETLANKTTDFQDAYASRPDAVVNQAKQTLYGGTGIMARLEQEAPKGTQFTIISAPNGSRHIVAHANGTVVGSTDITNGFESSFAKSRSNQGYITQLAKEGKLGGLKPPTGTQLPDATMRLIKSQMWASSRFSAQMGEGMPKSSDEVLQLINERLAPKAAPPKEAQQGGSQEPTAAPTKELSASEKTYEFFKTSGTPEYLARLEDGEYRSESQGVTVTISGGKVVAVDGKLL